ncbi:hypothetical protein V2J09_024037 [Rumex salicifolius]
MKHYMLPRSPMLREAHPSSELLASPNPSAQKQRSNRKQRGFSKENSDPNAVPQDSYNSVSPFAAAKPSMPLAPAAKMRSPLPPRPPPPSGNPLKRKLILDAVPEVGLPCSSDSEVKVVVRMRPPRKDDEDTEVIVQKVANDSLTINEKNFTFDYMDIFQLVGAPLVENCLAGFNSSVFAYGQTGSGKTYTMWGPANALLAESPLSDHQGLTPRVLERLFARMDEMGDLKTRTICNQEQIKHSDKQLKYQCRCSFLEIYNEQVTDLLDPSQKNLQIREDVKSGVYVDNLTEEYVSSLKDVKLLLSKGMSNRRTGSTSINAESSRSHSVFTCVVESRCKIVSDGLSSCKTSRINLVDLAGSERQKLTGAAGERLKEAGNINRSLSQLGSFSNWKTKAYPIQRFQIDIFTAGISWWQCKDGNDLCKSETFSTLRFAQRAKAIKNKAVVNEVMQDDVNFLRDVIRQLKEELLLMKANGGQGNSSGAYSNGWNARRSLNLLKFSLNRPVSSANVDDDGDEVMEIDDETVEKLCIEAGLDPGSVGMHNSSSTRKSAPVKSREQNCHNPLLNASETTFVENQALDVLDVTMEEGMSEIDEKKEDLVEKMDLSDCMLEEKAGIQSAKHDNETADMLSVSYLPEKSDGSTTPTMDSVKEVLADIHQENTPSAANENIESGTLNLSIIPCNASPVLQSPSPSISPRVRSSGRKSLRTSSMLTASQKEGSELLIQDDVHPSSSKSTKGSNSKSPTRASNRNNFSTTEDLAASLHHGMEIIDNHMQNSPLRRSPFRFSFKPADLKQMLPVEKVDVGVQTLPEDTGMSDEDRTLYLCCKSTNFPSKSQGMDEKLDLQLVPVDGSMSVEKSRIQVPKAVEKVLAGAIRREMALEEFCSHQTAEIMQLKRLVQQYKHERECNAIIGQIREDKIVRLENLMDGILPTEEFLEEELSSLKKEHELLMEKYDHHPDVLSTRIELNSIQNELERYRNFFDLGERDVLLEEIQDLRTQLQFYADTPKKTERSSCLQLTYPSESSSSLCHPLTSIPESTESNTEERSEQELINEKYEQEINRWTEAESQWISLAEELRAELDTTRSTAETLKKELQSEKNCSDELKEALQLAMEGHARMLEQYAELEERHMQMLARHRNIQDGIEDVKKAAAKAGVRGPESRFINSLAKEISALKVEKERETRYLRDENKALQSQLRDTAEAVQAAGELLVRLKEAEEAVVAAQKRAADVEEEMEKAHKQMEKLKKRHEKEASACNRIAEEESHLPNQAALRDSYLKNTQKLEAQVHYNSADDHSWKDEFKEIYNGNGSEELKFDEPSSWFSGC